MSTQDLFSNINREIIGTFALLDSWFDRADADVAALPVGTVAATLRHVVLTNRDFLKLVDGGCVPEGARVPVSHLSFDQASDPHCSDHRTGTFSPIDELRAELRQQLYCCLCALDTGHAPISGGKSRLQVYECIYFLNQHCKRHLEHLESVLREDLREVSGG